MSPKIDHPAFQIRHERGEDYAAWLIRKKAERLVGHFGFSRSDRDDIEQELALDLIERWPNFDASRSSPKTFIAHVVTRKVSKLIRHRLAEQRRFEQVGCSLDDDSDDEVTTCFRTGQRRDRRRGPAGVE